MENLKWKISLTGGGFLQCRFYYYAGAFEAVDADGERLVEGDDAQKFAFEKLPQIKATFIRSCICVTARKLQDNISAHRVTE